MKKTIVFLLLITSLSTCTKTPSFKTAELKTKLERIDSLLLKLNARGQFNGGFLFGRGDSILINSHYGHQNAGSNKPLDDESIFEIASITKVLTATLVFKMIEQGYFELDSRLTEIVPVLPYPKITIRQLLTHTSGIPDYYDSIVKQHWNEENNLDLDTLIQLFGKYTPPLQFDPGEKFEYSNTGYLFLAKVIENASGQSYDDMMQAMILTPAKMEHTKRKVFYGDHTKYASGHILSVQSGSYVKLKQHEHYSQFLHSFFRESKGPGSMASTTEDLWKFSRALTLGRIVSNESLRLMWKRGYTNNGEKTSYAHGWQVTESQGERLRHHRGGTEGYNSFFSISLDHNYTYVLLSNYQQPYLSEINRAIQNILNDINATINIPISGAEQISLLMASSTEQELVARIKNMQDSGGYYFTLKEFNEAAWKYWTREEFDTAFRFLKLATVAMPDNAGVWEVLAEAYMETNQYPQAIDLYKRVIQMLQTDNEKKDKEWVLEWIEEMKGKINTMSTELD